MPSKKVATSKKTGWDEKTPVPGTPTEYIAKQEPLTEPHGLTNEHKAEQRQKDAATRVHLKVEKALRRTNVGIGEQIVLARIALLAIADGPKSVSRDIAVSVMRVISV